LSQIACLADNHLLVEKHESGGRAVTRVTQLSGEERVAELARMISGAIITEQAINTAREMMMNA